jgi:hypothetical protein
MSNDAKLGLVLGVAIVLVIALVFFRNDTLDAKAPSDQSRAVTLERKDPPSPPTQIATDKE